MSANVQQQQEIKMESAKQFVFAGNALFTVQNTETGGRYTFKVQASEPTPEHPDQVHFVRVLNGPDNTADYRYIGLVRDQARFFPKAGTDAPSAAAFGWLVNKLDRLPEKVKLFHEGRCGRCGRTLTVPESIESGFGPECITKL